MVLFTEICLFDHNAVIRQKKKKKETLSNEGKY